MVDVTSVPDSGPVTLSRSASPRLYGTIVIVGGGCYGSYYLRQLLRARNAGALNWKSLQIVDSNPTCRVAGELFGGDHVENANVRLIVSDWVGFFVEFLDARINHPAQAIDDAIVPSPLMPHLMYDWLLARARLLWPARNVGSAIVPQVQGVPWQRANEANSTRYISFAEWDCPINCIEPHKCPHTRAERTWSLADTLRTMDQSEPEGSSATATAVFHCSHRAYGVGMIDVRAVIEAEKTMRAQAELGPVRLLVGTVSHCHGALNLLSIG